MSSLPRGHILPPSEVISRRSEPGEASVRCAPASPRSSLESSHGHPCERHHFSWPCGSAGTSNPRVHSGFPQGQELEDLRVGTGPLLLPSPSLAHLYQGCKALLVTHSILKSVYGSSLDSSHPFLGYVRKCSFSRKSKVLHCQH